MKTILSLAVGIALILGGILAYGTDFVWGIAGHTVSGVVIALGMVGLACAVPSFYEEVCEDKCVKRW